MTEKKSPLKFPCDFPIKIMGKAGDDFEFTVVAIIRKHVPKIGEGAFQMKNSKHGTYSSMTVTIPATSQKQLDGLYKELSECKQVIMAL